MPILLTTAFDPGDLDPGKSYTHVKIVHLEHDVGGGSIRMICKRGYLDGGDFVPGAVSPTMVHQVQDQPSLEPPGTDYTSLVSETVVSGDVGGLVYDVNAQHLYQYLLDQGAYAGTIA